MLWCASLSVIGAEKKIVLLAGADSHGAGEHEFKAGCLLLKKCLDQVPNVKATVSAGWPKDESIFNGADAVFIYCDGGSGHLAIQGDHLQKLGALMKQGVGLGCAHYAVEVPKEKGGAEFLQWIGGYFEMHWSVNPTWTAIIQQFPRHPITRGVLPLIVNDEWYYHMRFPENMQGVTPILSTLPPLNTLDRPDGPHSGNPEVRRAMRSAELQHVMWVTERADGGRGFGFTGGHFHRNWGDENFRKLVLNAILWSAKMEVPESGVVSRLTEADLKENLGSKGEKKTTAKPQSAVAEPFVSPTSGAK